MADIPARFPPPGVFSAAELASLGRNNLLAANIAGLNPDIDQIAFEDIWAFGGVRTWLTAAAPLIARSTDANDTAGGTGARTLAIFGLDSAGALIFETLDMAGTSNSAATSQSFFRVNGADVVGVGLYGGANLGDITIETTPGAIVQSFMRTGVARQEQSHFTIPANFLGLVFGPIAAVEANKAVIMRIKIRANADVVVAPFSPEQILFHAPGIDGVRPLTIVVPIPLNPLTDVWFDAQGAGVNAEVQVVYGMILVPT